MNKTRIPIAMAAFLLVFALILSCSSNDSKDNEVSTVLDGTWNKDYDGSAASDYAIRISGYNWTFLVDGFEYSKGVWSSNTLPTAPSNGTVTLTLTQVYYGSGLINLPAEYNDIKTNTATFTINATGNQLIIEDVLITIDIWDKLKGTYTK